MNQIPDTKNHDPKIFAWLISGCALIFLMVIIGGITRLTHSGLSITEWNLIMGAFPPVTENQWQVLFEKYQQSPEFREVHYYFNLPDFKKIFWWEYSHRLIGRLTGIVFIVPFFYFLIKKKISKYLLTKLINIFLLGALQGILGWYMVISGLADKPSVSHYRLAAHLILAFCTFGYTFWVAMNLLPRENSSTAEGELPAFEINRLQWLQKIFKCLFGLIILQIIFGAFVAGLKAGYLYPTFPKMGDNWIAPEVKILISENNLLGFFEEGAPVQFIHRCLGVLIFLFSTGIWLYSKRVDFPPAIQLATRVLMLVVMLQFFLGILTLIKSVPLHLAAMHQAGAFLLFATALYLLNKVGHNARYQKENN